MRIVFSEHAIARLKQRNISELQVFTTINSPHEKVKSYRNRTIYRRIHGKMTLEVVTILEKRVTIIISTYMVK